MVENIISNPFVGCTARDMNFGEVRQYWCSPFSLYQLNEGELFSSKTPIVIEGVRGSGKTMLLKYLSYTVQRENLDSKSIDEKLNFLEERSFGTYFRYKSDFCNLFERLDCDNALKERIFKQYFELFIIREIINNFKNLYVDDIPVELLDIISDMLKKRIFFLDSAMESINEKISQMDEIMNTSDYDDEWKEKIVLLLNNGNMIHDFVRNITNRLQGWKNILFVILLDEYENLGILQTTVNTLIKQVDESCNLTYRLGMRPAGMDKNNSTYVGNEKLQVDRDFLLRRLVYKNFSEYKHFAFEISKKRLLNIDDYAQNGLTDISVILGAKEDFDYEASRVAKGKKQFKLIRKQVSSDNMDEAISVLSNDEKLLEMYNILLVSRGNDYRQVGKLSKQYLLYRQEKRLKNAEGEIHKYDLDYGNKYRMTLLYMLLTIYGERKMYYSFNTFLYLSSGSINDFISLCRNVFKFVDNEMLEKMIQGNVIDPMLQTYAALDTAEDQRKKVSQSNNHGSQMYSFIDNMGGIFEEYHHDLEAKYPETNQFAFTDENQIHNDKELNIYLVELINSGAIMKKQNRQKKSLGQPRGVIYQLNRIFAPIYQYSYRTRGGFNQMITTEQFREMLNKSINPAKFIGKGSEDRQLDLFEYMEGEEGTDEFDDI